jgi:hypothetical protein
MDPVGAPRCLYVLACPHGRVAPTERSIGTSITPSASRLTIKPNAVVAIGVGRGGVGSDIRATDTFTALPEKKPSQKSTHHSVP